MKRRKNVKSAKDTNRIVYIDSCEVIELTQDNKKQIILGRASSAST
jgi:hypothetical protein